MSYVSDVNAILRDRILTSPRLITYGQNVTTGSCLSGLTRNLMPGPASQIFNSPNAENTLVGAGFGMNLKGWNALYIMKQQDFLLLAMDHLVNTWNIVRQTIPGASFTILMIVVDSGFEGPQSSLNNFADFCSMAHIQGWAITNKWDAKRIIETQLVAPGFRLIGVSQRLFREDMPATEVPPDASCAGQILKYEKGDHATIVAANFAFPQALGLWHKMEARGIKTSLFSLPAVIPDGWGDISDDVRQTGRLVVVDDSKSENRSTDRLMLDVLRSSRETKIAEIRRTFGPQSLVPNADSMVIDSAMVTNVLETLGLPI